MPAPVSILILTKNEVENVDRCIGTVFEQQTNLRVEVIVVDSGSTDGTLEKLERYPVQLVRIRPSEFHHSRTRNFIAERASGDVLVYLAGDAWPTSPMWLSNLLSCFADPSIGAAYGRHLPKPGCSIERSIALAEFYGSERIVKNPNKRHGEGFRFYFFSTVNCAMRRTVWEQFRFPEEQRVFEDLGIARKILLGGWSIVYEPGAAVYHSHDYPASKLFRRYFDLGVIWNKLGIDDDESMRSMRRSGIQGLSAKFRKMRDQGCTTADIGRAVARDLAKGVGFGLGRNERHLPLLLKRRLSDFQVF